MVSSDLVFGITRRLSIFLALAILIVLSDLTTVEQLSKNVMAVSSVKHNKLNKATSN